MPGPQQSDTTVRPELADVVGPAAAKLLASRFFFESIVVNASDVVLVTKAEPLDLPSGGPKVIYVNEAFTRMTGYEPEDIIGLTPRLLQSPDTDRRELDRLKAALVAWEPVEVELLNRKKDGTEFWVQISITPVSNERGWYTHWIAVQRDITARKLREVAVRVMLESTSDLVLILDQQHRVTVANPSSEKVLGIAPADIHGTDLLQLVHPDDHAITQALLRPVLGPRFGSEATAEVRVRHGDGRWLWLQLNVAELADASDAPPLVLACSDITEHRATRSRLRELNGRFRSAFDDAPIGMAITALSGRFLQVNRALADLLGYAAEELLLMTVQDVTHPEDAHHAERQRRSLVRGDHDRRQHETRFMHADGSVVGILHSTSVVRGADEAPSLLIDHIEDITARKAFEHRLQHYALHDTLTTLPNRALFMDRLDQALQTGRDGRHPAFREGTRDGRDDVDGSGRAENALLDGIGAGHAQSASAHTAVLFCDIDRFKTINDTYGHHIGDMVLTTVARRLQAAVKKDDTVARLGGDELVVLCPSLDAEGAAVVSARLLAAVREPVMVRGHAITVTLSIGVAIAQSGTTSADQLLRDSDDAMYVAKEAGRDRFVLHEPRTSAVARQRLLLRAELPQALRGGELRLHYQPQLDLVSGAVVGLEALVRWEHPQRGLLMPGAFIEIAEEAGLMKELGQWVLRAALTEVGRLGGKSGTTPVMWINVSASELEDPDFAAGVENALRHHDLPGVVLGIEITESVLMIDLSRATNTLTRLQDLGVSLAIDDFGTGYSSLSYIAQFPVDVIKIDRSFISGLDDADRRREAFAIVTAVIGLAHSLHLTVIAEGIETPTQELILHGLGCDQGQGYLLGRPGPSDIEGSSANANVPGAGPEGTGPGAPGVGFAG
jgi:diguanylate cyclase (GGDEF)-like protein/PAS domain S-box-containing protein